LDAKRRIPVYAEALFNCKALVQKLIEETDEMEWDAATMPKLLAMLTDEGLHVELLNNCDKQMKCFFWRARTT